MAQVGVQQPANLMEMFSSPSMMLGDIAAQQVNDQTLGNLLNRQQAQQSMAFDAQEQPFKLDQMGLANQTTREQLPGVTADSSLKQDKATLSRNTLSEQHKATFSKLAKEVSDDDLAVAENGVKQMLTSDNPQIQAHGKTLFNSLYEIRKERDKLAIQGGNSIALAKETGNQARLTEQQAADNGKYKKASKYGISLSQRLDAETDPRKKLGLLVEAAQMASQEGNQEAAAEFTQRAQALQPLVQQWLNANPKAGAVDIGKTAPGISVNETQPLVPDAKPQAKPKMEANAYQSWFANAKKLNPGLSDQDIEKEAINRGYK